MLFVRNKIFPLSLLTFTCDLYMMQGLLNNLCSRTIKEKEKWTRMVRSFTVHQKLAQHCKSTRLQFKKKNRRLTEICECIRGETGKGSVTDHKREVPCRSRRRVWTNMLNAAGSPIRCRQRGVPRICQQEC